jgi:hypothetical protein
MEAHTYFTGNGELPLLFEQVFESCGCFTLCTSTSNNVNVLGSKCFMIEMLLCMSIFIICVQCLFCDYIKKCNSTKFKVSASLLVKFRCVIYNCLVIDFCVCNRK